MLDSHLHADSRSFEDYRAMAVSGISIAITCAYYPYKLTNSTSLLDHFNRIKDFETERAAKNGLDLKVALGIHPSNILNDHDIVLERIKDLIHNKEIIAIGEIGLDKNTLQECEIFKKQLEIADTENFKVIVHTPRKNKFETLKRIKEILLENINPKLVTIDHINLNVIDEVIDEKYQLGITVQPEKMEIDEAIAIFDNYGFDNKMLNSDVSYMRSDILSVPKTVNELKIREYNEKDIAKVSYQNAMNFYGIK
ncbi:MAG: TatD family hydrolase [Methanobrevibacter sp.]|jgi:predicted metal-dependent TIM-barrel fold hydrolase|nr:TatD family hydrolase [Candidatus Methanoflexus mossambicus]